MNKHQFTNRQGGAQCERTASGRTCGKPATDKVHRL